MSEPDPQTPEHNNADRAEDAESLARFLEEVREQSCPVCAAKPGKGKLKVELHRRRAEVEGARWWDVKHFDIPGPCESCVGRLHVRRILAGVLMVLPAAVLMWFSFYLWAEALIWWLLAAALLLVYAGFFGHAVRYGWADRLVYGLRLQSNLGAHAPKHWYTRAEDARFPLSLPNLVVRLVIAALILYLTYLVSPSRTVIEEARPGPGRPASPVVQHRTGEAWVAGNSERGAAS